MGNRFGKKIKFTTVIHEVKENCCKICGREYPFAICPICDEITRVLFNDSIYEYFDYLAGPKERFIEKSIKEIEKEFQN